MNRLPLLLLAVTLVSSADEALKKLAKGNIQFTARSYQKQTQIEKGNLLICGISAEIILSLLARGAREETQAELYRVLSEDEASISAYKQLIPSLNQNNTDLKLLSANRLYVAKGFRILCDFKNLAKDPYKANVQTVNFAEKAKTADIINDWIAANTNNKITDLISSGQLDDSTRLVLVNALYFNANWLKPFNDKLTKKQTFHTSATESKEIDMMHVEDSFRYKHCGFYKAQFLEMPFHNSNISFIVVLPDVGNDISNLENQMEGLLEMDDLNFDRISVTMPTISMRSTIDFRKIMEKLGVRTLFQKGADLKGISRNEGLFVDFIAQQTFINVTAFGVEAAAATAVGTTRLLRPAPSHVTFTFIADRPFLYIIKEKQYGVVLFVGKFIG